MNQLNDSVIICELPKRSEKKSRLLNKKNRGVKRAYYESPLAHIQQSRKRFCAANNNKKSIHTLKNKKTRTSKRLLLNKSVSFHDSIIVLSDTENEKKNQNGADQCKTVRKCVKKKSPVKNKIKSRKQKKVGTLENNNSSSVLMSDVEELGDVIMTVEVENENTAKPKKGQEADDITVVWSSMKALSSEKDDEPKEKLDTEECNICLGQSDRLFMIDCSPNKKYLSCLNSETENLTNSTATEEIENNALLFNQAGLKLPKARKRLYTKIKAADTNRRNIPKLFANSNSTSSTTQNVPENIPSTSPPSSTLHVTTSTAPKSIPDVTVSTSSDVELAAVPSTSNNTTSNVFPNIAGTQSTTRREGLREIIIDGNNVAMSHSNGRVFSEAGLKLVIDYFQQRGHKVKAFVPQYRRSAAHQLLEELHLAGTVIFTPSRYLCGRKITPYDDRFILQYATMCEGIVVSSDQYRDLYMEKPEWRNTIMNRLLAPTFVGDFVMFPEDPLGRKGPRLDEFLRY